MFDEAVSTLALLTPGGCFDLEGSALKLPAGNLVSCILTTLSLSLSR